MALTLNNTLCDEEANSYCDVAYADDYWDSHFNASKAALWTNLSDEQKASALIAACRVIESARFTYNVTLPEYAMRYDRRTGHILDLNLTRDPVKFNYYQRLQFPRNLDTYLSKEGQIGQQYIPEAILQAQCEQAVYLLSFDETAIANRLQGITMDRVDLGGAIATTQEYATTGSAFAPMAYEMVKSLIVRSTRMSRA